MQSWSLDKFVGEYGVNRAQLVWGVSRHAIEKALNSERKIQVIHIDGHYHIWEGKLLNRRKLPNPEKLRDCFILPINY